MKYSDVLEKVNSGEGVTLEEIKIYQKYNKPIKHIYGKYGTLAKMYIEEHNWVKAVVLGENYPEYLHNIDKEADELYESMYNRLSENEMYKRTGNYLEDVKRENAINVLIEEEILNELVYVE